MQGTYLLEHRLRTRPTATNAPGILLLPGLFDARVGEYNPKLVGRLLRECNAPAVAEAHLRYQGQCGRLKPAALMSDMLEITLRSNPSPLLVCHSATTLYAIASLIHSITQQTALTLRAALLIGPHIPGYETTTNAWIRRTLDNESMAQRLAETTGHPFVQRNYRIHRRWYGSGGFKTYFEGIKPGGARTSVNPPVELCFFEQDTLTELGQWKLCWLANAIVAPQKLGGHHRGLDKTPDSDEIILDFARRHI